MFNLIYVELKFEKIQGRRDLTATSPNLVVQRDQLSLGMMNKISTAMFSSMSMSKPKTSSPRFSWLRRRRLHQRWQQPQWHSWQRQLWWWKWQKCHRSWCRHRCQNWNPPPCQRWHSWHWRQPWQSTSIWRCEAFRVGFQALKFKSCSQGLKQHQQFKSYCCRESTHCSIVSKTKCGQGLQKFCTHDTDVI